MTVLRSNGTSDLHTAADDPAESARFEGDLRLATFRDPAGNLLGAWQRDHDQGRRDLASQ